jgi:predicted kinase
MNEIGPTQKNKLVMFIGKTHSGKTTFAKVLTESLPDVLNLEADPISIFMKEEFPKLRELDDRNHSGDFKEMSLKFKTFLLFVEFAMSLKKPVVLSNSNMWVKGREAIFELCKKFNYEVIGVYFNLPEDVLSTRIDSAQRETKALRISKDFQDLLIRQKDRMQIPDPSVFSEFFVIKSELDLERVKNEIISKLK